MLPSKMLCRKEFLSTPSARRATAALRPATPERWISIHALREEGDTLQSNPRTTGQPFLSTPSARRATERWETYCQQLWISIHALREEGDLRQ